MEALFAKLWFKIASYAGAALVGAALAVWLTHAIDLGVANGLRTEIANGKTAYSNLQLSYAAAEKKAVLIAVGKQAAKDDEQTKIATADAYARGQTAAKIRYIIRKVPQYVTPAADARFAIPCGFVRVHDAAALGGLDPGQVANPAGKLDDDACEFTASQVASTVAENYGRALDWRQQLIDLQAAIRAGVEIDNREEPKNDGK